MSLELFNNRPIWQRFLTLLAGPAMNILMAFVITVGVLVGFGDFVPAIASVEEGMPAAEVGLQVGDRIVSVDGKRIDFAMEFSGIDLTKSGDSVRLGVERGGQELEYEVPFQYSEEEGRNMIGIRYSTDTRQRFGFFEAIGLSFKWMYLIIAEMLSFLGNLIFPGTGSGRSGRAGGHDWPGEPGGAFGAGSDFTDGDAAFHQPGHYEPAAHSGTGWRQNFAAGHREAAWQAAAPEQGGLINLIGMGLMFLLMIFLTYQDIVRLLS